MKSLDPLIYHLHRLGSGSWPQLTRAIEAFDPSLDVWSCARVLAEHAIVETDFDHNSDWSVTTAQLVDAGKLGTVAWGGTSRALGSLDIDVEIGARNAWIAGVAFSYTHGVRVRRRGADWPRGCKPTAASTILDAIPALSTVVGAQVAHTIPLRKAERLEVRSVERRNPGGFRFYELRGTWEPSSGISVQQDAAWKVDRATFLISRNHRLFWVQRDIALFSGFLAAAKTLGVEHLIHYDDGAEALQLAAYPQLPIAYVRAILLCGARESESPRRDKRIFRNVQKSTASWLATVLGLQKLP